MYKDVKHVIIGFRLIVQYVLFSLQPGVLLYFFIHADYNRDIQYN